MKKLLLILVMFSPVIGQAQSKIDPSPMPLVDSQVVYTGVIKVDSVSKEDLYSRAKRFFVMNYKSANAVIQLDDKEAGQIVGKGVFKVYYNMGLGVGEMTSISHVFSVTVKEGRYKYEVSNLVVDYYSAGSRIGSTYISGQQVNNPVEDYAFSKRKHARNFATDIHDHVSNFIQRLIDEMAIKTENKKDDW